MERRWKTMVMLQFIDCPNCKKRVRETAEHCHHCGTSLDRAAAEHAQGGYDSSDDDFDYDEYLEREFENKPPVKKLWIYVAWVLVFATLFPIALQIMAAFRAP